MPYPGVGKMIEKQDEARRGRKDRAEGDEPEAFTEDAACVVCGKKQPSNEMFFSEKGLVCTDHHEG